MCIAQPENKIKNQTLLKDKWLAKDKVDHFASSAFLTAFGYYWANVEFDYSHHKATRFAFGFSFSAGTFKEIYDWKSKKGHPSYKDLIADILGIGFGLFILSIGTT
jgi:uncharacterized protein YfiM (DUF2279 family)